MNVIICSLIWIRHHITKQYRIHWHTSKVGWISDSAFPEFMNNYIFLLLIFCFVFCSIKKKKILTCWRSYLFRVEQRRWLPIYSGALIVPFKSVVRSRDLVKHIKWHLKEKKKGRKEKKKKKDAVEVDSIVTGTCPAVSRRDRVICSADFLLSILYSLFSILYSLFFIIHWSRLVGTLLL